jgi:WD40 repeat protein
LLERDAMPPKLRATANEATPSRDASAAHTVAPEADATQSASESAIAPGPWRRGGARALIQIRDKDRYDVLGEHGRGGLGRVSRAHDRDLARTVAIKELIARTDLAEIRFLREALITARLEHPGIVPVYEAGRWPDGTPFYAMKLVAGRSLRELLAERHTVDERQRLLHHVIAVADAIAYAHERDIIHRDLKPANVIVGDFGETIVIDWGLAKDLSSATDLGPASGNGSGSGNGERGRDRGGDLTSAGCVLGTPAYMAPEQELGGRVDQRADVFAIGAMLWELCSLHRVPPTDLARRHRLLRRAGIDRDLIVIIDKALAPDPADRYPDAGALAADLKAFKAGGHIASRRYSLPALLVHWARRHRALAVVIGAALAVVAAGSALYVHDLADERDRTHQALTREAGTRQELEHERDALTLRTAQLLLATDPTAALDQLAAYHGRDQTRARQLEAEARGRGVARLRASPHSSATPHSNVMWVHGFADGSFVSLSAGGSIVRTTRDGGTTQLATNVSLRALSAYAPRLGVLAYSCDANELCLLDLHTYQPVAVPPAFRGSNLSGLDFGPDGQLAVISQTGELRILALGAPVVELVHKTNTGGHNVKFLDEHRVALSAPTGVTVVALDGAVAPFTAPDGGWEASPRDHLFALTNARGEAYLVDPATRAISDRTKLCHELPISVKVVPGTRTIAFACQEGTIGLWDLARHTTRSLAQVEGRAASVWVSESGRQVFATNETGTITMVDLDSQLVSLFRGHAYRVLVVAPPNAEFPQLISGDVRGELRVWPLPATPVSRVGSAGQIVTRTAASAHRILAATYDDLSVLDTATLALRRIPHRTRHMLLAQADDGQRSASFGDGGEVELWSGAPALERTLATGHTAITSVVFPRDGGLITAGRDGQIARWTDGGTSTIVASLGQPIRTLAALTDDLVAVTSDGQAWRIGGRPVRISPEGAKVTAIRVMPDHRALLLGLATGDVLAVDGDTRTRLLEAGASINELVVSPDGAWLAAAVSDETIRIAHRVGSSWITLAARARSLAFTADGTLIAGCTSGDVWTYAPATGAWRYLSVGALDLTHVVPRPEGGAILIDSSGQMYALADPASSQPRSNRDQP